MERLQWWLLLLSAVMFSMSGCSSVREWRLTALRDWSEHPTHFASSQHMGFSMKSHPTAAGISEADREASAREDWWGKVVPASGAIMVADAGSTPASVPSFAPTSGAGSASAATSSVSAPANGSAAVSAPVDVMDMTGRWRGHWVASGAWGERRESEAEVTFTQSGGKGTSHMVLADTVAAVGVPEVVRHFGALGTPMNFRISRGEVVARFEDGPAVAVRFTRVGDRLYGRMDASPSFLLVLDRQ